MKMKDFKEIFERFPEFKIAAKAAALAAWNAVDKVTNEFLTDDEDIIHNAYDALALMAYRVSYKEFFCSRQEKTERQFLIYLKNKNRGRVRVQKSSK